jgi:hypothetical protein
MADNGSTNLKMHKDSVFISSVMFTIALVLPIPNCMKVAWSNDNASFQRESFACLTIALLGLLIVWTTFIRRIRSAWFAMSIIVWIGAFPIMVLPLLQHHWALTPTEWIYSAIFQQGLPRRWALSVCLFMLMLVALLLPIKAFLKSSEKTQS